jgi:hypothetical protein
MRRPVSLGQQKVRVQLPREVKIKDVSLLRAEKKVVFQKTGKTVELSVPSVGMYEVIALEV